MTSIRELRAGDLPAVLAVVREAFAGEGQAVADLTRDLVSTPTYAARGWVALDGGSGEADDPGDGGSGGGDEGAVVGVVVLTDGWVDADRELVTCPVLSPLAVRASHQRRGIGTRLVETALAAADAAGAPAVVLEGDPAYYGPRGFTSTALHGVSAPSTAIPEAAFQWVRLRAHEPWMRGRFVYPDVFWRHDAVGLRDWRRQRSTGLEVSTVTIGARNLAGLAGFYAALLGLPPPQVDEGDDWVALHDTGGWSLGIQLEPGQEPAVWPAGAGEQHMQLHLEIRVDDLDAGEAHALTCGARAAEHRPDPDVRVMLDPEGHPFCLWVET